LKELGFMFDLDHPNIVACRSLIADGTRRYLVCELMEAGALRDRIGKPSADARVSLRLVAEAARGVAYAHDRAIIHRDLKPENILLTREGGALQAKVSDFGVATLKGARGASAVIGTPAYMAPEQFSNVYDERVDVYALGVVAYEILCGVRPFYGDTAALHGAHLRAAPELPAWLPSYLVRVLRKCLAKDPEARYRTAYDLHDALLLALDLHASELTGPAWPVHVDGAFAIAASESFVLVASPAGVVRLDSFGRVVERSARADEVLGFGDAVAVRREGTLTVFAHGRRTSVRDVPLEARVALGPHGEVAIVAHGAAHIRTPAGRLEKLGSDGTRVLAASFVGREGDCAIALERGESTELRWARGNVSIAAHINVLDGSPVRDEMIARKSHASPELFVVDGARVTSLHASCGALSSDGSGFYGCSQDGSLVSIDVATRSIARSRGDARLVAAAAFRGGNIGITSDGWIQLA
jgi:eukaryotic-like serine/threonine-protein kinase